MIKTAYGDEKTKLLAKHQSEKEALRAKKKNDLLMPKISKKLI